MKSVSKSLATLALAATALVSLQAQAVVVTFGGQTPTDGSIQTSSRIAASNIADFTNLYFVETFDSATANASLNALVAAAGLGTPGLYSNFTPAGGDSSNAITVQTTGCGINSFGAVSITSSTGGLGIRTGSVSGVAAAPGNPNTNPSCYGYGPGPTNPDNSAGKVKIDYSPLIGVLPGILGAVGTTFEIAYLGLFYGSIDDFNNISLYNNSGNLMTGGTGVAADGIIKGSEIRTAPSGNQFAEGSNLYVNFDFNAGENFTAFEFTTTGRAFEIDNIVVGLRAIPNEIPEPASLALVGLGLVGVAAARRRKQAK